MNVKNMMQEELEAEEDYLCAYVLRYGIHCNEYQLLEQVRERMSELEEAR